MIFVCRLSAKRCLKEPYWTLCCLRKRAIGGGHLRPCFREATQRSQTWLWAVKLRMNTMNAGASCLRSLWHSLASQLVRIGLNMLFQFLSSCGSLLPFCLECCVFWCMHGSFCINSFIISLILFLKAGMYRLSKKAGHIGSIKKRQQVKKEV